MLRYTTDRARPGLVALYDIRPGNGVGKFLQPRSPHGATRCQTILDFTATTDNGRGGGDNRTLGRAKLQSDHHQHHTTPTVSFYRLYTLLSTQTTMPKH